jgi:hypothetical protein
LGVKPNNNVFVDVAEPYEDHKALPLGIALIVKSLNTHLIGALSPVGGLLELKVTTSPNEI